VTEFIFNSKGLAPSLRKVFQKDSLIFPEKILGVTLWDKQKEIFRAIYENERVAVPACNHASKTHTAACLTLSFLFTYYPSKVITTSALKEQVKDALWSEVRTRVKYSRTPLIEEKHVTAMGINLGPDWYAVGLRPQDSSQEAFQGRHSPNILLLFDEACHDEETEILTNEGFKRFYELQPYHKVLTMNPFSFETEYVKPTRYYVYDFKGDLYHFKSRTSDFMITGNHFLFFQKGIAGKRSWHYQRIKDIKAADIFCPRFVNWKGKHERYFTLPAYLDGHGKIRPAKRIGMRAWLSFLGWYFSEGYLSNEITYIQITQQDPKKRARIKWLIKRMGFNYSSHGIQVIIHDVQLANYLAHFGCDALNKRIPKFVFNLDKTLIKVFLKAFHEGDGYIKKGQRIFYTSSKFLADGLQELILKTGKYASVIKRKIKGQRKFIKDHWATSSSDGYVVAEYSDKSINFAKISRNKIKKVPYEGKVYCVEAPPYHLIYTRRNGRCMWGGNSGISENIWDAAEGLMTSTNSHWLALGNPFDPLSPFGEACNSDEWVTIHISAYDTPNVKAGRNIYPRLMPWDWPEKKKKQWGEDSARYQIRVLGQFPEKEEEKLIPYSLAKEVFARKYNRCTDEALVIGLDPAGLGKDKTVWVLRQGSSIVTIKWVLNATDEAIGRRTLELAETYRSADKPTIINIDGGWGKGIYEYLKKYSNSEKVKINLVFLSSNPENDENEYYNLRTQVGFRLKEAIERGLCLSPSAKIVRDAWLSDVTAIKVIEDPRTGKRKLENKRKLKKRLKRSPDFLDATLLSFVSSYRTPPAMVTISEFQYKEANKETNDNSMFPSMMHHFKIKRRNPIFFFRNNIRSGL